VLKKGCRLPQLVWGEKRRKVREGVKTQLLSSVELHPLSGGGQAQGRVLGKQGKGSSSEGGEGGDVAGNRHCL